MGRPCRGRRGGSPSGPDRVGAGARDAARGLLLFLAVLVSAGCGEEDGGAAARPPAVGLEVATDPAGTTFRALVAPADLAPTFQDGERRAWSLAALFGEREPGSGARVEVTQADGTRVDVDRPFAEAGDGVWVLRANRRGEAQLERVDPAEPFPSFHGRGGNRGRSGAAGPRLDHVVRLRLILGAADGPPAADAAALRMQAKLQLEIFVDGVKRPLDDGALVDLKPLEVRGDGVQGARAAWAVRDLVGAVAGAAARLVEVRGVGEGVLRVSAEAWRDATRVPLLRLNRRGRFKFHWASADLAPVDAGEVRDATQLWIVTHP